jgi:hypothetical protein
MLDLLQAAIRPGLSLQECVHDWHHISSWLREPPRRRSRQLETLDEFGIPLS